MSTLTCPDCGKLVASRFPLHDCTPKPKTLFEILAPINPTVSVIVETSCDRKTDVWHAKITVSETRNGQQYGGNCVTEFKSRPGTSYRQFMRRVRFAATRAMGLSLT
jgi:hypothetical protein